MPRLAFVLRLVIVAGVCAGAAACDDNGVTAHMDLSVNPNDLASSCGHPGDKGANSTGVGQFCESISDCEAPLGSTGWMAGLCSIIGDPTSHFCTFVCDPTKAGVCGSGASCVCNGVGCGCTPAACVPPPDGSV